MKAAALLAYLKDNVSADLIECRKGVFYFYRGFFYRHGKSAATWAAEVRKALDDCRVEVLGVHSSGEQEFPFKGDAPTKKSSHFVVGMILSKIP